MSAHVVATHVWPIAEDAPVPCAELHLDWGGPVGDRHHGLTMRSDTRQSSVFPRGTEIRNHRQVSIVDVAELAMIADALGIPGLAPGVIADNICTDGVDNLTTVPRMTRMVFEGGVVLMLGGENNPCTIAGDLVRRHHGTRPEAFPKAALHRRGVTAWVEHPGIVRPGEQLSLLLP